MCMFLHHNLKSFIHCVSADLFQGVFLRRRVILRHCSVIVISAWCCVCRSYGVVSMCVGTGMGAAALIECPGRRDRVTVTDSKLWQHCYLTCWQHTTQRPHDRRQRRLLTANIALKQQLTLEINCQSKLCSISVSLLWSAMQLLWQSTNKW